MCNGWNHPPGCRCGWGGDGHLGRRTTGNSYYWYPYETLREHGIPTGQKHVYTDSHVNPNARCPVCGAQVFFYQSPYGGRVFFDALGWPWPKHPCTDNSQHYRPLTSVDSQSLDRLYARLCALNLPTRLGSGLDYASEAAPATEPATKKIDEVAFNTCMEQGEAMQRSGDIHQAARLFAEAIAEDFRSARAWLALARVLTDKAERAYCLTKVLRVATDQDHIKRKAIEGELAQLKVDQLKHPRILWPTKSPVIQSQQPQSASGAQPSKYTVRGSLIVRIAKGGHHVVWLLLTTNKRYQGEVQFRENPSTALLQAILQGLQQAEQLAEAALVELTVISNYESVIKQARGEAKISNEQDRALLDAIHSLSAKGARLTFIAKSRSDVERYFTN